MFGKKVNSMILEFTIWSKDLKNNNIVNFNSLFFFSQILLFLKSFDQILINYYRHAEVNVLKKKIVEIKRCLMLSLITK